MPWTKVYRLLRKYICDIGHGLSAQEHTFAVGNDMSMCFRKALLVFTGDHEKRLCRIMCNQHVQVVDPNLGLSRPYEKHHPHLKYKAS